MEKKNYPTYLITTLGCKVNQYESNRLGCDLASMGMAPAPAGCPASVCVVNTCTVTREAARKSRQMVRRLIGENPGARIYAIGCAAQVADYALSNLPETVVMVGNEQKDDLPGIIARDLGLTCPVSGGNVPIPGEGRVRAYLKVQDGCDNFCTYCIIPHLRGRSRSRPPGEILEEMKKLGQAGFNEVVLTGIHLGDYGKGFADPFPLWRLVEYLVDNTDIPRIRLSSLEPMDFSYQLLDVFARHPRLCPHLHLPLQHGSDRILSAMHRRYNLAEFDGILQEAVRLIPGLNVTTDVMVGFPGETAGDFEIMYNYLAGAPIFGMHVFRFSPHPGTYAWKMEGKIPRDIKKDRMKKLVSLGQQKKEKALDRYPGKKYQILTEKKQTDGLYTGHTGCYAQVRYSGGGDLRGRLVEVKITSRQGEILYGENPEPLCSG